MLRIGRKYFCSTNTKDDFLVREAKRLACMFESLMIVYIFLAVRYTQHMKQAASSAKVNSAYALGVQRLVSEGYLTEAEAGKWESLNERNLALHRDTKELLWHSRRRISRDFASSEDGLGKFPKREPEEE